MAAAREKMIRIFKITALIIFALIIGIGTYYATMWVLTLREADKLAAFQEKISSMGIWGFFVLLVIQYIQIVVAFIPGGPIQLAAGALYGPVMGLAVCLLGTALASMTVFTLVKRFGSSIISLFVDEGDIMKYKFLQNAKRLEIMVMAFFFIPGAPKDALTYLFALTPLSLARFMLLSVPARLPAMITSIFAGNSISNGDWRQAAILFIIITAVGLLGLLFHHQLVKQLGKHGKN